MPKRVAVTYRNLKKVEPYARALRSVGVEPVLIDPEVSLPIDGLDGLLLTGGTDLNPKLYHQDRHPAGDPPDDARDALELRLLGAALERDLPVLAICRGMQLFNIAHGGTLLQDVEGHRRPGVPEAHAVTVEAGARLAVAVGRLPTPPKRQALAAKAAMRMATRPKRAALGWRANIIILLLQWECGACRAICQLVGKRRVL